MAYYRLLNLLLVILFVCSAGIEAQGQCAATTRTWDADNNNNRWDQAPNWSADNRPDSNTENALIVSASRPCRARLTTSISCLEVTSGELRSNNNRTLTIEGDYFRSPSANSIVMVVAHSNFWIDMAGAGTQSFEVTDDINNLRISNNTTVNLTDPFAIVYELDLTGTTTTVNIQSGLTMQAGSTVLTIPAGVTVVVESGATLTANQGIVVNGTLQIESGAQLIIGSAQTLNIGATGRLELNGSSGNTATINSPGAGQSFTMTMAGTIDANYFRIDRMDAAGLNVTGTIAQLQNGEFHSIANAGYAITLGGAAIIPANMDSLGFFDDDAHGNTQNIDASGYNVSNVFLDNYSGSIGGEASDNDPNNRIDWGTAAGTELSVSNNTAVGSPPATINTSSADTLFATFAFALTAVDTATDITDVTVTMTGTADSADVDVVKLYRDAGGGTNCVYDAGTDVQVGGDLTLSGSPPTVDVTFGAGDIQTSSDTDLACFHVIAATSSIAVDSRTIQFAVQNTSDVTNTQAYSFSATAGPPVSAGSSSIIGNGIWEWQGDAANANWNTNANWRGNGFPNATRDCEVGVGLQVPLMNIANSACQNMDLQVGGSIDFNNTANTLDAYGSLTIASGYSFLNSGNSIMRMLGATNQTITASTAIPNDLVINNTGAASSNIVSLNSDLTVGGDVTVTGGVLRIPNGQTLTVNGNLTVQTGAELEIEAGGTLEFANGSVLTVDLGGTLTMVGNSGLTANVTSTAVSNAYTVDVNGTIAAQYYSFARLGTTGVTINGTIDGTYHLQNGSYSYPVNNTSTLLNLTVQVPTNTMDDTAFSLSGSGATGTTNINTTGAAAGTLTINNYSGDLSGPTFDTDPTYNISWANALNNVIVTQEAAAPATVDAGSTYVMGRYGFQQEQPGASFSDTDVTQLEITLTGTGDSFDVSDVRIYYDSDCDSSGGTLLGSGAPSGSPASITFNISANTAVVEADVATPPLRCIYVEYAMDSNARNGRTIGAEISLSTDVVNDQAYPYSSSTTFPVSLGTATINGGTLTRWTGAFDTDWHTPANWTNGVPTNALNCEIDNVANDPIINGGSGAATCDSIDIGSGVVTMQDGTGAVLEFFGNFENTGTINYNSDGTLRASDTGSSSDQTLTDSSTIERLTFSKTLGGLLTLGGSTTTINSLTFPGGSNFEFRIPSTRTLVLPNGVSVAAATLNVQGGGEIQIGNGQTLLVNGGTFQTSGTNDAYPQSTGNKGTVTVQGAGTWNFSATSGTVDLTGFVLDYLSTSGVVLSGTTTLSSLDGGQLTNLSNTYASVVGFQFDTPNIPATATNVGWNWGPSNTPPGSAEAYTLAASAGCGGNTITFDQWFGDFFISNGDPDTTTKVSAVSCTINITAAASPVNLLSFAAEAYDQAVRLSWKTGLETEHLGFNVYRSRYKFHGYTQINNELVRNDLNSSHYHGDYQFDDTGLVNSTHYYYMIEDIAFNGARKLHGPVIATPEGVLGALPAPDSGQNHDSTGDGDDSAPGGGGIQNDGAKEIIQGVRILSQTSSEMVIEIEPGALTWSASPLNGSYDQASIEGYNRNFTKGHPEWLEKSLLIPVNQYLTDVQLDSAEYSYLPIVNDKVLAAAPDYVLDVNSQLVAQWYVDAAVYGQDAYLPSENVQLSSSIEEIQGQKFVRLNIYPIQYNPVQGLTKVLEKARLHLGLSESVVTPSASLQPTPVSAMENVLRISFNATGFYDLSFDDLEALELDWVFAGEDPNDLRLFYNNEEFPIEVTDGDSLWNSGDSIRFYINYVEPTNDDQRYVFLSASDVLESSQAPLRVTALDGDPAGHGTAYIPITRASVHLEQNNSIFLGRPLGSDRDHFFWKRIYSQQGQAPGAFSFHDFSADMAGLDDNYDVDVYVTLHSYSTDSENAPQELALWINSLGSRAETVSFNASELVTVRFTVPGHYFIDGSNDIRIEAVSENLNADEWIVADIDKVRIDFYRQALASGGVAQLRSPADQERINIANFATSSINVYDVSTSEMIVKYSNTVVNDDGGSYSVELAVDNSFHEDSGYLIYAFDESQVMSPLGVQVQQQYTPSTLSGGGYNMLVLGPEHLRNIVQKLVDHRSSQGLSVQYFDFQQIYDEWNHGVQDPKAIREFVNFAHDNWTTKPQYILFIGDATQDPKNYEGHSLSYESQAYPFIKGTHFDFGSDNYFVTSSSSSVPFAAVGRIPTNDPSQLDAAISKIIAYESGDRQPINPKNYVTISDQSPMNENFAVEGDRMIALHGGNQQELSFEHLKMDTLGEAALKSQINISVFPSAPLMVNFLGHGAEDRWSNTLFLNADAKALNNQSLPIVSALNCLNALFYYSDPNYESLAESFVLNENGGAVAFWGSSTMTVPSTQIQLANNMQELLFNGLKDNADRDLRLGDVIVQAKSQLGDREFAKDTQNSWMLIGDPALKIPESAYIDSAESNQPAATPDQAPAPAVSSGGGGCSAFAATNGQQKGSVPYLELIFLLLPILVNFALRRVTKKRYFSSGY